MNEVLFSIGLILVSIITIILIILLPKCCSFLSLFCATLFNSILGFIFNAVFFFYPKYFESQTVMEGIVIIIQFFFIIGILVSIIFIRAKSKLDNKDNSYTNTFC